LSEGKKKSRTSADYKKGENREAESSALKPKDQGLGLSRREDIIWGDIGFDVSLEGVD